MRYRRVVIFLAVTIFPGNAIKHTVGQTNYVIGPDVVKFQLLSATL
jgi:hypothetical protein